MARQENHVPGLIPGKSIDPGGEPRAIALSWAVLARIPRLTVHKPALLLQR